MEDTKLIRGTVTHLFYSSPRWSAGKLLPNRNDVMRGGEISFAGNLYCLVGEYVVLSGRWVHDEKYGRQFKVTQRVMEPQGITIEGLAGWLAVHGEARGIGPRTAERIAREFGENFTGILKDNPEQIAIFARVPLENIETLAAHWFEREELNVIGTKLSIYELTEHQIHALYKRFGSSIVTLLEENPYLLIGEVDGMGFRRVDEIARKVGVPLTHPGRFTAVVHYSLQEQRGKGSTCMERGNLVGSALHELKYEENDGEDYINQAIETLCKEDQRIIEHVDGERIFYALPSCWRHEYEVMEFLRQSNCPNPNFRYNMDSLVNDLVDNKFSWLDASQQRALTMSLRNRACLISGGAGVGKTTLLKAIVEIYQSESLRIKLCAPTGKAARRIEEVVGHQAETIHRTLGYHPIDGFPNEKLETDVVIVDESSMIDSALAYYLLRAIPAHAALVLVGDHHQLPPVGAGALLRDCIQNELLPMAILNHCHRQAGPLKTNCSAILQGEVHPTEQTADGSLPWVVLRKFDLAQNILDYIEGLFVRGLREKLSVDPLQDVQFLTPMHGGPLGTRSLNILLQRLHQQQRGVEVEPVNPDQRPKIYVGDKVIQTKNNYKLDIMNGHQGYVIRTEPLVVDFGDGKVVSIPKDCKGEIELAYALTVHKVQGSQFPVVVFVCHKSHTIMLNRSLLYTAATRAMQSCVIVGDDAGISRAAKTIQVNDRRTLLPLLAKQESING